MAVASLAAHLLLLGCDSMSQRPEPKCAQAARWVPSETRKHSICFMTGGETVRKSASPTGNTGFSGAGLWEFAGATVHQKSTLLAVVKETSMLM